MRSVDRTGIEVIDRDDCLELLRARGVGRIGIVVAGQPLILPVNYSVLDETIVFRSAPGSKLTAGPRSPACFQIDDFDESACSGWSVMVVGRLEEVDERDTEQLRRAGAVGLRSWAPGERDHWMRLFPRQITGRRV